MSEIITYTATVIGIEAHIIEVEADVSIGLGAFQIVGLPDHAIRESRERVTASLSNVAGGFPIRRVVVNLAPAGLSKGGTGFDLPIAIAILKADKRLPATSGENTLLVGELSLQGRIRPVAGILAMLMEAKKQGIKTCILPRENAPVAAIVPEMDIYIADTLKDIIDFYTEEKVLESYQDTLQDVLKQNLGHTNELDYADVKGHIQAKRALEIAAAGRHHILLIGPPGSGKSMLASRFPSILSPLSYDEILQVAKIYSLYYGFTTEDLQRITRPFRTPHHSVSGAGLVGGGSTPRAGEVSLAHHGVLFLDELAEYSRATLDLLRQPLEDKQITITRAKDSFVFPADFQLIAATNPCPCGYLGDADHECRCSVTQITRYRSRLSGPLLDRIDLQIEVPVISTDARQATTSFTSSKQMKEKVIQASQKQKDRYQNETLRNGLLKAKQIQNYCKLDKQSESLLQLAVSKLKLSGRGYDSILKVSRTIADLENSEAIQTEHLAEALQYRNLDRSLEF